MKFFENLTIFLHKTNKFHKYASHIFYKNTGSMDMFIFKSNDRSAQIKASFINDETVEANGCLGQIAFLKSIVDSPLLKNNLKISIPDFFTTKSGGKLIKRMVFTAGKTEIVYKAIDPSVGNISPPSELIDVKWNLEIEIDDDLIGKFTEIRKLNSSGGKNENIELIYSNDDQITMRVENMGNNVDVTLPISILKSTNEKVNIKVDINHLSTLLELVGDNNVALCQINDKVVKTQIECDDCIIEYVIYGKKE